MLTKKEIEEKIYNTQNYDLPYILVEILIDLNDRIQGVYDFYHNHLEVYHPNLKTFEVVK